MIQSNIIKKFKDLKDEVQKQYKATLKGIFGSYARGKPKNDSDIDILVEFQKDATLLDLSGLGNFLEERLHHKVDIVSQKFIREELRSSIYKDIVYL